MKNTKELNEAVKEFNGLSARTRKDPTKENKELWRESLERLSEKVQELLVDKADR